MSADPLEVVTSAAHEAGELLRSYLGRLDASRIGRKSSARDLVTEADVAAERLLVARLRAAFPGHAIEAEEEVRDTEHEGDTRPRWFLDPLDGTVNFVHGIPAFAVSAGLLVEGVPEAAVVHLPMFGETFTARRGGGTHLNGEPVHVSDTSELGEAVLATGFPYRRGELPNDNLGNWNAVFHRVRGLRRFGSAAIDLAFTAAGRFDGYWELHLSPHDVAAGALLVREAGGVVTDLKGGDGWLRSGEVVAAGPGLHATLLAAVDAGPSTDV